MLVIKNKTKQKENKGFTLVELLVVISIIGVVMGLSLFGLGGARKSGRDAKRKSDLEQIRSALELYRSDCGSYPLTLGSNLVGDGVKIGCDVTNVYMTSTPKDTLEPSHKYLYVSNGKTYELCASLEQGEDSVLCGTSASCGSETCNYKVTNP